MLEHTIGILLHPDREWKAIRNERHSFKQVFFSHVPFLAMVPVLSFYYGVTQVGWSFGNGPIVKLTADSAMILCGMAYLALLAAIFCLGEFINWMSRTYGVKDSDEQRHYEGTALAVYIVTPLLLVGFVGLYPNIWFNVIILLLAGCYSVYLLYEGLPILMDIPKDQAFMYAGSVITIGLVLMVSTMVFSVIFWSIGAGPVYVS